MAVSLVTGGGGFIGSNLTDALLADGVAVRILDNFTTGRRENLAHIKGRIDLIDGDLNDPDALARAVAGVDIVYHEAALPSVPRSVADPLGTNKACVDGTVALLHAAQRAGVRRIVYAASSSAYGDQPGFPRIETMAPQPLSPYAVAKLACEYYCQAFSRCYDIETVCLRYFNVFGPRQNPKSQYAAAIPIFIAKMLDGERPTVYGDGEQSRDWTFVANVAYANQLAGQAPGVSGKVINVGCGATYTVNEVIHKINAILGTDLQPEYASVRTGDVKKSHGDLSRARDLLGYAPKVDFDDGLARTIKWTKAQ